MDITEVSEVIIEDVPDQGNEIVVEECTVEIQEESPMDYVSVSLDVEQTIDIDTSESIYLKAESITDEVIETKEEQLEDLTEESLSIPTQDLLIPTSECEVEIDQDFNEFECVYLQEEDLENFHTSEKQYLCSLCDRNFQSEPSLNKHISMTHQKNDFKCTVCRKRFKNTMVLSEHMLRHSNDDGYFFPCVSCDKTFKRKFNLDAHQMIHAKHKLGVFKCETCAEVFSTRPQLNNHMQIHTAKNLTDRVTCNICSKKFQKNYLRVHMMTHVNNAEYSCSFCEKNLSTKQSLYMHMNTIHADEGCYECTFCDKRFFWKSYLDRHITVHTKEKSHHCTLCSKSFTRKLALRKHISTHSHVETKGKYCVV